MVRRSSRRRVIKVGTSLLRGDPQRSTAAVVRDLANAIAATKAQGEQIALVTSGAVGLGCRALKLEHRPAEVVALQAAAAVGQGRLMALYQDAFGCLSMAVAQVLLTRGDLASRRRYQNACRTLEQLLSWGVIPIINENDTLATDELRFGDNDTLSALVAVAIGADELILLTDVDRLYSGDPRQDPAATPIDVVRDLSELNRLAQGASSGGQWGTGGMTTKLAAARIATASGIRVRLADGRDPAVLIAVLAAISDDDQLPGTVFQPASAPLPSRKGWLAHALVPQGTLHLDPGAERALLQRGASLLAVGINGLEGHFARHDAVRLVADDGRELGRGLSQLSSDELEPLLGQGGIEVVNRDQLVLTTD